MSRAAVRQLAILGVLCLVGLAAFIAGLGWLSSLTATGAAALPAIDAETRTITTSIRNEPPNLDSMRATDATSIMVFTHIIEGLLRYDERGDLVPGVAERWEIGTIGATFWLRENALWSDGKPVTAHDFVFAWRTAVDPATASQYAFIIYPVKNGEAINKGEMPPTELGVRAVGDRVLEVEFENPIAYFDKLVAFANLSAGARGFLQEPRRPLRGRRRGLALQRPVRARELGARRAAAVREEPDVLESRLRSSSTSSTSRT